MITSFDKALVPIVIAGVVYCAGLLGISPEMPFSEAIGVMVVALCVYLVPNKR